MKNIRGEEYERVFRYFDEDGDGKISASELKNRLSLIGLDLLIKEAETAVKSLDKNGDGLLDMEDLVALMEGAGGDGDGDGGDDGANEEDKLKDLREAFAMYDVDGCGFINPNDLKSMLCRLGESKSIDECKLMIKKFDLNGDGVLSFEEFRVMMQ